MYFAIIDAQSEISRLATIAHGKTVPEIALWFAEEFRDNFEMYCDLSDSPDEADAVLKQCDDLCELAESDALDAEDLDGMCFSSGGVSTELIGVYDSYESFVQGFLQYVSDKPKYVKIKPQDTPSSIEEECDRLNTLLIRASI